MGLMTIRKLCFSVTSTVAHCRSHLRPRRARARRYLNTGCRREMGGIRRGKGGKKRNKKRIRNSIIVSDCLLGVRVFYVNSNRTLLSIPNPQTPTLSLQHPPPPTTTTLSPNHPPPIRPLPRTPRPCSNTTPSTNLLCPSCSRCCTIMST